MNCLLGTGFTSMVGSRFAETYPEFEIENLDLATGVDITNSKLVQEKVSQSSASALIHFAAFTDVNAANNESGNKTGLCYKVNVVGTQAVAAACAAAGKYLIHISTDFVFDGQNPPPGGYIETDTPHPIEWYGQTKAWAEEEVKQSGAKSVIARIAYPYRTKFAAKLDLVRNMINKIHNGTLPAMFTDHIITPTYIDDIVFVLKAFLDKQPTGIYHVVGSSSVSDYDIAMAIADVFNLDKSHIKSGSLAEFLKTASRPYQKNMPVSNAKLQKDFGIHMSTLKEGLQKVLKQSQA